MEAWLFYVVSHFIVSLNSIDDFHAAKQILLKCA